MFDDGSCGTQMSPWCVSTCTFMGLCRFRFAFAPELVSLQQTRALG